MKNNSIIFGVILMAAGVILLLSNLKIILIDWSVMWPAVILVPGLLFETAFIFNRKNTGLLVPGGILTVIGILFFVNVFYGWQLMEYLWPVFPLSVAFGLLQVYIFGKRERALLICVFILAGFSLISFTFTGVVLSPEYVVPGILILVGIIIIFSNIKRKK